MPRATDKIIQVEAAIDAAIRRLAWLQGEKDRLIGRKGKKGPSGPKGPVKYGKRVLKRRKLQPSEQTIVAILQKYPEPWATLEIVHETMLNKNTCLNAISRLVRDGYVTRVRRGFYQAGTRQ